MIAFEAATPFQVFNCINIYKERHSTEKADIYLYLYAADLTEISKKLSEEGLFHNVYLLSNIPRPGKVGIIAGFLNPGRLTKGIALKAYDVLYISYTGSPNMILYNLLLRKNGDMTIKFYEDGLSSYYNGLFSYSKSIEFLRKIKRFRNDSEDVDEVFLYEPKLNKVSYKRAVVSKLSPFSGSEIIRQLNNIYNITESAVHLLKKSKYIYFDHNYKKYVGDEFFFHFDQTKIVNYLSKEVGQILVKVSPLSDMNKSDYQGERIIVSNFEKAPWEVLIHQDLELENRCLITVCSNAVMTPKSVYGREPYVLILGKALYNEKMTDSTDVWTESMGIYYEEVRNLYNDKERFMVAESMEQACAFIRNIDG